MIALNNDSLEVHRIKQNQETQRNMQNQSTASKRYLRWIAPHQVLRLVLMGWLVSFDMPRILAESKTPPTLEHAIHETHPGDVQWTQGFWKDRWENCRTSMIPEMWDLMKGYRYKPFYQHFRIAAGLEEGDYHGAQWNDGDFYKWMEALCMAQSIHPEPVWDARLDKIVATIAKAQREDGYIHTPVLVKVRNGDTSARPFQDRFNFEMYNMGHLMTAACVHHQVTGKDNFLNLALKAASFLKESFRNPTPELARNSVCPSHYMGLIDLYRTTGNRDWLALARHLIDMRDLVEEGGDDNQDRLHLRDHQEIHGHAVRANYLYTGVTDLFLATGDPSLWPPLQATWQNLVEKKLYITGGCGALYDGAAPDGSSQQRIITRVHQAYGRNYQLPNLTAHNETCANIGNVLWNWRMFQASGDSAFIDVLELALYNSVLSGVSLEGKDFFYVNPLRNTDPLPVDLRWSRTRVPFVTSFCCPPNLVRTVARSPQYAYALSEKTLWVNLYGSSDLQTQIPESGDIHLQQTSLYPWKNSVRLEWKVSPKTAFSLKCRIPGWTQSAQVLINGKALESPVQPGQYLTLDRQWKPGDIIDLRFEMPAQLMTSHPLVEETRGQVALKRGPIVYCLESPDLPEGVSIHSVKIPTDFHASVEFLPQLLQGIGSLRGEVVIEEASDWEGVLYRPLEMNERRKVNVRFIPYYAWANRGASEMSVWLPIAN